MKTKAKKATARKKVKTFISKAQKGIKKLRQSKTFKSAKKGLKKVGGKVAAKTGTALVGLSEKLKENPKV